MIENETSFVDWINVVKLHQMKIWPSVDKSRPANGISVAGENEVISKCNFVSEFNI